MLRCETERIRDNFEIESKIESVAASNMADTERDEEDRLNRRKEKGKQRRAHGGCLWLSEAKKDVTSCEKRRRGANTRTTADVRMGEPGGSDPVTAQSAERTRGTETSKYPQEEKITMIPRVVASESGRAQTAGVATHRAGL